MSLPQPESANYVAARDQYIFELTGIQPDPRYHIPLEETRQLVRDTQVGDTEAMERLIARRLVWIYESYATRDELKERYDLEPADIMQIGSLATIEAAKTINADTPVINELLHNKTPYIMGRLIVQAKLLPTITENGHKVKRAFEEDEKARMIDKIVAIGDGSDVATLIARDRSVTVPSPHELAERRIAQTIIRNHLGALPPREKSIIEARFGLGRFSPEEEERADAPDTFGSMTLQEVGENMKIYRSRIWQIQILAQTKLGVLYEQHQVKDLLDYEVED